MARRIEPGNSSSKKKELGHLHDTWADDDCSRRVICDRRVFRGDRNHGTSISAAVRSNSRQDTCYVRTVHGRHKGTAAKYQVWSVSVPASGSRTAFLKSMEPTRHNLGYDLVCLMCIMQATSYGIFRTLTGAKKPWSGATHVVGDYLYGPILLAHACRMHADCMARTGSKKDIQSVAVLFHLCT